MDCWLGNDNNEKEVLLCLEDVGDGGGEKEGAGAVWCFNTGE